MVVNSDNVIEQRILTVERAIGNQWLVLSGLSAGDRLVVEGQRELKDGQLLRVVHGEGKD